MNTLTRATPNRRIKSSVRAGSANSWIGASKIVWRPGRLGTDWCAAPPPHPDASSATTPSSPNALMLRRSLCKRPRITTSFRRRARFLGARERCATDPCLALQCAGMLIPARSDAGLAARIDWASRVTRARSLTLLGWLWLKLFGDGEAGLLPFRPWQSWRCSRSPICAGASLSPDVAAWSRPTSQRLAVHDLVVPGRQRVHAVGRCDVRVFFSG